MDLSHKSPQDLKEKFGRLGKTWQVYHNKLIYQLISYGRSVFVVAN
jgi:hypothetical protein